MTVGPRLIADYQAQAIWLLCGELDRPCPSLADMSRDELGDLIIELRGELQRRDLLPEQLAARLTFSALNFLAAPGGYRVFASDKGRLWATTTSRHAIDYRRGMKPVGVPDAIDADTPAEMAAKLRKRLGQ